MPDPVDLVIDPARPALESFKNTIDKFDLFRQLSFVTSYLTSCYLGMNIFKNIKAVEGTEFKVSDDSLLIPCLEPREMERRTLCWMFGRSDISKFNTDNSKLISVLTHVMSYTRKYSEDRKQIWHEDKTNQKVFCEGHE